MASTVPWIQELRVGTKRVREHLEADCVADIQLRDLGSAWPVRGRRLVTWGRAERLLPGQPGWGESQAEYEGLSFPSTPWWGHNYSKCSHTNKRSTWNRVRSHYWNICKGWRWWGVRVEPFKVGFGRFEFCWFSSSGSEVWFARLGIAWFWHQSWFFFWGPSVTLGEVSYHTLFPTELNCNFGRMYVSMKITETHSGFCKSEVLLICSEMMLLIQIRVKSIH